MIQIIVSSKPSYDDVFGLAKLDFNMTWLLDDGRTITHVSRPTRNGNSIGITTDENGNRIQTGPRGLPATARFPVPKGGLETVMLYEPLERWMYAISRNEANHLSEAQCHESWKSLLSGGSPEGGKSARFFSDFAGTETNQSFVLGTNLEKEPIKVKPMVCGGAIIKIIGVANIGGPCWEIDAVDPLRFWETDPDVHWWRLFRPTNSVRIAIANEKNALIDVVENVSEPFHQFDTHSRLAIFGKNGKAYIQQSRVRILAKGERWPSPYVQCTVPGFESPFYPNPYEVYQ